MGWGGERTQHTGREQNNRTQHTTKREVRPERERGGAEKRGERERGVEGDNGGGGKVSADENETDREGDMVGE